MVRDPTDVLQRLTVVDVLGRIADLLFCFSLSPPPPPGSPSFPRLHTLKQLGAIHPLWSLPLTSWPTVLPLEIWNHPFPSPRQPSNSHHRGRGGEPHPLHASASHFLPLSDPPFAGLTESMAFFFFLLVPTGTTLASSSSFRPFPSFH